MLKVFILLGLLSLSVCERNPLIYKEFNQFILKYQKNYSSIEEYNEKYLIFEKNFDTVSQLQALHPQEKSSFTFGFSSFMDITTEEFEAKYLNLNVTHLKKLKFLNAGNILMTSGNSFPASHDWREHGAVAAIKNQGSCGSCWAFSTVGNLEGQYFLKTGNLTTFSEQQLVDCDKVDQGCNGGLMEDAFKYLNSSGGAIADNDYSYTGSDGKCKFNITKVRAKVVGYKYSPSQNETEIAQMLFETGPLSVAINATPLQFYFWGVFDPWTWMCDPNSLNHGVTLVGYGNNGSKDYWIVRNSWGTWWGESGYFRIRRGTGSCGINTYVISSVILPVA